MWQNSAIFLGPESDGLRSVVRGAVKIAKVLKRVLTCIILCVILTLFVASVASATPLLDVNEMGFNGQTRGNNYDTLIDAYFSNANVVTTINSNLLWVPWFKTSSSSQLADLQSGTNCNSGQYIDFTHNCMVTDEFSQVGILVSMGKDQARMNQFYNTVIASKSTYGNLPGWRIYRDVNTIEACKAGINSNCDTASDGTARIIIALFTASKNSYFADDAQKANYAALAKKLADDMLTYEVDNTCRQTSFGSVCHWLAGGANVKTAGIDASDFAYTGYYPDAIIAMLAAYSSTDDIKYYSAAKDFTLNYLQAANFNSQVFTVPPGKSFKWVVDSSGVPRAQCTDTCSPVVWDAYDASRALGMCQANYYAKQMGVQLPNLQKYCDLLAQKHMSSTTSMPLQFYPDGSAMPPQSGYFAQGLEALHFSGVNSASFKSSLDSALSHFVPQTKTFDYAPSIGVYTQSFAVRALGMGIGRDANAFKSAAGSVTQPPAAPMVTQSIVTQPQIQLAAPAGIVDLAALCTYGTDNTPATVKSDVSSGGCRSVAFSTASGDIQMFACEKSGGYVEIYKLAAPAELDYKACLANGCIAKDNGFARFIPTTATTVTPTPTPTTPTPTPTPAPAAPTTAPSPAPTHAGIAALSASIAYNSITGSVKSDVIRGVCRTVVFSTSNGDVKIQACEKTGGYYEVYRQAYPGDLDFKACMGKGCVDKYGGFSRVLL